MGCPPLVYHQGMELFDTHCHIDVDAFDADREQVLSRARRAGVRHLLVPAIQREGWQGLWELCMSDPHLHPAIGLHPVLLDRHADADSEALEAFIQTHRPVAIGEIGLDYAIRSLDKTRQQILLEAQLRIAAENRLPVVLHIRKAHEPMLRTLARFDLRGGICHAFNGSEQQAGRYLDMGFKFGFGGALTFPNARHLHELASKLPLDSIVLETDAPDMSGAKHRYQRNSPEYLPEVVQVLSDLRGVDPERIAEATTQNAFTALQIKAHADQA